MATTVHNIKLPNAASLISPSVFDLHDRSSRMLSLASGKCSRQCLRHHAPSQNSSCCQCKQALPYANAVPSNTTQNACPYFTHSRLPSSKGFVPEHLINPRWQNAGTRHENYTSSNPLLSNLIFEAYTMHGNVQDLNGRMERVPQARIPGTSERVQEVVESIVFKAAAQKVYFVLTRADEFLHVFLRSFLQETSLPYMDRTYAWKRKVAYYNRHLLWPVVEENQNEQNEQNEHQTATRVHHDKIDFPEHEQQITKNIETICHDELVLSSSTNTLNFERSGQRDNLNCASEFPDAQLIDVEIQKELAEALVKHVQNIKPILLGNVASMSIDYRAARNALAAIKKLKEIFDVYKRCWDPDIHDPPDQRA